MTFASLNHPADDIASLNHPADDVASLSNCSVAHFSNADLPIETKKRNEAARKLHASIRKRHITERRRVKRRLLMLKHMKLVPLDQVQPCRLLDRSALNLLVSEKRIFESEEWLSAPIINASHFILAKLFERKPTVMAQDSKMSAALLQ